MSALLLAALAAGSTVAWGLKLRSAQELEVLPAPVPVALQVDASAIARALGATDSTQPPQASAALAASRMVLVGVVAHAGKSGAALIAIDGKPPKPVAVGAKVGDEWVLTSVASRRAVLRSATGSDSLTLDMPVTPTLLPNMAASP
jgi:general secretion pathway protein C